MFIVAPFVKAIRLESIPRTIPDTGEAVLYFVGNDLWEYRRVNGPLQNLRSISFVPPVIHNPVQYTSNETD